MMSWYQVDAESYQLVGIAVVLVQYVSRGETLREGREKRTYVSRRIAERRRRAERDIARTDLGRIDALAERETRGGIGVGTEE